VATVGAVHFLTVAEASCWSSHRPINFMSFVDTCMNELLFSCSKEVPITNHSILHVYFKDLSVLRFRRDVIYSWNDLLGEFQDL